MNKNPKIYAATRHQIQDGELLDKIETKQLTYRLSKCIDKIRDMQRQSSKNIDNIMKKKAIGIHMTIINSGDMQKGKGPLEIHITMCRFAFTF